MHLRLKVTPVSRRISTTVKRLETVNQALAVAAKKQLLKEARRKKKRKEELIGPNTAMNLNLNLFLMSPGKLWVSQWEQGTSVSTEVIQPNFHCYNYE